MKQKFMKKIFIPPLKSASPTKTLAAAKMANAFQKVKYIFFTRARSEKDNSSPSIALFRIEHAIPYPLRTVKMATHNLPNLPIRTDIVTISSRNRNDRIAGSSSEDGSV